MPAVRAPERGDVMWLQFNPQAESEQSGRRPALVISPRSYNQRVGLALLCPITSRIKDYALKSSSLMGWKRRALSSAIRS